MRDSRDTWPPAPTSDPPQVQSAKPESPVPGPSARLGFLSGFLLYAVPSAAGVFLEFCGLLSPQISAQISRVPFVWLDWVFLSNALPVFVFFCCRRRARPFAGGLLGGCVLGCALHLMYVLSVYQEAIATDPRPGIIASGW